MSADRRRPSRSARPLYDCVEDMCDAYEYDDRFENDRGAERESPRPHRHAVRLIDGLDGEESPRRGRPVGVEGPARKTTATTQAVDRSGVPSKASKWDADGGGAAVKVRRMLLKSELSEEGYAIRSVRPEGEGETVAVVLSVPGEAGAERVKLHLLVEQYAELGIRPGVVDEMTADALLAAGRLCAAVKRGMNLLAYGDRSARRLVYKLTAKGVERAVAEEAAAYLSEKGYIREDDTARRRAEQGLRKQWGPRRIREDLRAQGFTADAVDEAMETLADVDFEAACAAVIRKKYRAVPADRADRQKLMAALMRLGYDGDTIRAALRRVACEDGE